MLYILNYRVLSKEREDGMLEALRDAFEVSPLMPGACVLSGVHGVRDIMKIAESTLKTDRDSIFIVPCRPDECDGYLPDPIAEWIIDRK